MNFFNAKKCIIVNLTAVCVLSSLLYCQTISMVYILNYKLLKFKPKMEEEKKEPPELFTPVKQPEAPNTQNKLNHQTSAAISESIYCEVNIPDKINSIDLYVGIGKKNNETGHLIKEGYGVYIYNHQDNSKISKYIGQWAKDKKSGDGIFLYSNGDVAIGRFEHNYLNRMGAYFWYGNGYKGFTNQCKDDYYQAFFGNIKDGKMCRGVLYYNKKETLDKNELARYIYFGEFANTGEKSDDKGMIFDLVRNFFFIGKFAQDKISERGYEVLFDSNLDITSIYKVGLNSNHMINEITYSSAVENQQEVADVMDKANWFVNSFVKKDTVITLFKNVIMDVRKIFIAESIPLESEFKKIHDSLKPFKTLFREIIKTNKETGLSIPDSDSTKTSEIFT